MSFQYKSDQDDIVTITMDMPEREVNVINKDFFDYFQESISKLKNEKKLRGVILTSSKKTFLAGGDIDMLFAMSDPEEAFNMSEFGKKLFLEFETLGVPIVAALNGSALGGGMELALACHYRISINRAEIKFGFPEVTLGLLPGGGGITRLVRLLGLEKAMDFLIEGKQISSNKAKSEGLIHDMAIDSKELLKKSKEWIFNNPESIQDWHKKGARRIFLLIQTLPTFWATRILILRIFIFWIFWDPKFPDFQVPDFQKSRNLAWARPGLGRAWALGRGAPRLGRGGASGTA